MTNSRKDKLIGFKERNLSFWQLGLILVAGQGIISMHVGASIAEELGIGTALTSIVIGNFLLFFIGLSIISMTGARSHTMQNIEENFRHRFAIIIAVLIVALFILWYAMHIVIPTRLVSSITTHIFKVDGSTSTFTIRIGSILGLICAVMGMWGITTIKKLAIITVPIQILFFILIMIFVKNDSYLFNYRWGFSFIGTLKIILTWLPGTINLSTFSRHAKGRPDAILSLFLIFVFHSLYQCAFVFMTNRGFTDLIFNGNLAIFLQIITFCFVILSFLSVNLLNIYWASIGWEAFFKKEQGAKGCAVIGLVGTVVYIFFESTQTIHMFQQMITILVANLGMVLISSALIKILIQHRVRPIDKIDNAICWTVGSGVTIYSYLYYSDFITAAIYGINTSILLCGLIVFCEELWWSSKKAKFNLLN